MKRIVCIADLHCGHRVGLTPPDYQFFGKNPEHQYNKWYRIQQECWNWYQRKVKQHEGPDILVVNGDLIDGRSEKSGGVELISIDRNEQIKMAADCINIWKAKHVVIVRGTPYHAGEFESWEDLVLPLIQCDSIKIGDHEWINVEGVVFDFKHHVGQSMVPYGRKTALTRDQIWNTIWAEAGMQPRADWIVRSHVHYSEGGYRQVGRREVWAITTPALQAMGSRYGARRCSGLVDYGFVWWNIERRKIIWDREIAFILSQRASALKF